MGDTRLKAFNGFSERGFVNGGNEIFALLDERQMNALGSVAYHAVVRHARTCVAHNRMILLLKNLMIRV